MNFRILTANEVVLANRVLKNNSEKFDIIGRLITSKVAYVKQGNFTTCLLALPDGPTRATIVIGVTKRMPLDIDRPDCADRIAFRRAVENYVSGL